MKNRPFKNIKKIFIEQSLSPGLLDSDCVLLIETNTATHLNLNIFIVMIICWYEFSGVGVVFMGYSASDLREISSWIECLEVIILYGGELFPWASKWPFKGGLLPRRPCREITMVNLECSSRAA